ncbi:MAG: glutamate--tRNA ligase [Clostridiales bacterium]|nr:glutamate--tRNA ligase [Clostridiales bacterium]
MSIDKTWFDEMESRIPHGEVRTRFAPSPTGYMHVGNLRTALYTYLIARHAEGKFILRIEDTDQGRLVADAVDVIYATMRRCGLTWDEGPDVGGPVGPYIQTERRDLYGKYAELLIEKGLAYRCFCSEERLEELHRDDPNAKYDRHCLSLTPEEIQAKLDAGEPYVIRQRIPEGSTTFQDAVYGDITVDNAELDDQILIKSDGLPTYNFANVIDDHLMGITHVVRGAEYLSSAPKYNLLYEAFGWEIPTYVHCSSVMFSDPATGAVRKMSKRYGDPSYEDLVAQGYLSQAVVNYVSLLGWAPHGDIAEQEFFTMDELIAAFDIAGISKSPSAFDMEKLNYFNATYLRSLSPEEFAKEAEPWIRKAVKNEAYDAAAIAALLQARCEKLSDIPEKVDFFDTLPEYGVELYTNKKSKTTSEVSLEMLKQTAPVLAALADWSQDAIHGALVGLAEQLGVKNATLMWPLRIAAAGKAVTPGGAVEICRILGKDETLRRMAIGMEKLS